MIIDSSAVIAVLRREPEAAAILDLLGSADEPVRISAANYLEAGIVIDRDSEPELSRQLDEFLADLAIEITPVTLEHAQLAREAHRRFGRWSGSPARLNFGDCFAYALARATGEPLLFKGDDFRHVDIRPA